MRRVLAALLAATLRVRESAAVGSLVFYPTDATKWGFVATEEGSSDAYTIEYCYGQPCDPDAFYENGQEFGYGHGHREAMLYRFDLPTFGGKDLVRVTHVGFSCLEKDDADYEGDSAIRPVLDDWYSNARTFEPSWSAFFADASAAAAAATRDKTLAAPAELWVSPRLGDPVAVHAKQEHHDSVDFSDQFQLKTLVQDWMNGLRPNHGFLMHPTADGAAPSSIDAYTCKMSVTYEPMDMSRDSCFALAIVSVTTAGAWGSGSDDALFVTLVDADGAESAEVRARRPAVARARVGVPSVGA